MILGKQNKMLCRKTYVRTYMSIKLDALFLKGKQVQIAKCFATDKQVHIARCFASEGETGSYSY